MPQQINLVVISPSLLVNAPRLTYTQNLATGLNNSIMGHCGGCRLLGTLRDPTNGRCYAAGYANPVQCMLDPDIGLELVYADNPRLHLAHHEIMTQVGRMVEDALRAVRSLEEERVRYEELK